MSCQQKHVDALVQGPRGTYSVLSVQGRGGSRLGVVGSREASLSSGMEESVGLALGNPPPSELPLAPSLVLATMSGAWAQWPLHRMGAL